MDVIKLRQRMAIPAVALIIGTGLMGPDGSAATLPVFPADICARPGPFRVATLVHAWHDETRDRNVPVRIYCPATNAVPCPIILFSHGLGGSRDGYEYLGRHWASHGYVCVHPTHIGSDTGILRGNQPYRAMQKAAADPQNAINRPKDISLVLDRMTAMNMSDATFKSRLALDKVGIAGHSFGGYTSLASAGQTFVSPGGNAINRGDHRIRAAIAMSAPAKPRDAAVLKRMYASISIPCFHMTGTEDNGIVGGTRSADRRIRFDHMSGADNCLLILKGGDHMVFSGRRRRFGGGQKDARFHELILMSTTAFWQAYLRDSAAARTWLTGDGFKRALGNDGTFEKRLTADRGAVVK